MMTEERKISRVHPGRPRPPPRRHHRYRFRPRVSRLGGPVRKLRTVYISRQLWMLVMLVAAVTVVWICDRKELFLPYAKDRDRLQNSSLPDETTSKMCVISTFGLESSGTTFVARTLSAALGAEDTVPSLTWKKPQLEIHHVSQPHGISWTTHGGEHNATVEVIVPRGCLVSPANRTEERLVPVTDECASQTGLKQRVELPGKFYVNISSHVQWYRERGIDATAVIVVQDYSVHMQGKLGHNPNKASALAEDLYGKQLIEEAMALLHYSMSPNGYEELVLVSYETLMWLQGSYLFEIYERLGINSTFVPDFHDGNAKYVRMRGDKNRRG